MAERVGGASSLPQGEGKSRRRKVKIQDLERALETVHEQWWDMVEGARDPILLVNAETGLIVDGNPRIEDILEWPRERLKDMALSALVQEECRDQVELLVDVIVGEGRARMEGVSLRRSDGERVLCDLQGHLVLFRYREAIQLTLGCSTEIQPARISERTATFFQDLSQMLPLLLDFDQILDRIVERFALSMEFRAFALSLVEAGELKRLTLYTSQDPSEDLISEVQDRVVGALLHLGVRVNPTRLQHSVRERAWIPRCGRRTIGSELILPIPLGGAGGVQGVGGLFHEWPHAFSSDETALFSTFVGGIASSYLVYHSYREIEAQSYTDPLTGLSNRRGLFKQLENLLEHGPRTHSPLSVILLDVDHFKAINDEYGHKVGDEVLRKLADCLRQGAREMDLVTRFGGEEFLILLPGTDTGVAGEIAEHIRSDVANLEIRISPSEVQGAPGGVIRITVSLGVGSVRPGEGPDEVIRRVDEALYRAKSGGRNRMVLETMPGA